MSFFLPPIDNYVSLGHVNEVKTKNTNNDNQNQNDGDIETVKNKMTKL